MANLATINKIDEYIGKQLRAKRQKRGFTLSAVASEIGLSYQQIQKYEQAQSKVSAASLYKFAKLYGISIDNFFEQLSISSCEFINMKNLTQIEKKLEINILIINSNPEDETMTRKALSKFEHTNILCVHDRMQAMEVLKYKTLCKEFSRPDLIFLDIYLPKIDGIEILKDIKRDRNIQNIPVIILTSNINSAFLDKAYQNGASGYICKSFDFNIFQENIADCMKYWTKTVVLPSFTQA